MPKMGAKPLNVLQSGQKRAALRTTIAWLQLKGMNEFHFISVYQDTKYSQ